MSILRTFPGTTSLNQSQDKNEIRTVLGIDPGLASTGWGIVEYEHSRYHCLAHGVVVTQAGECFGQRLEIIYEEIEKVIQAYKPTEAGMETLYFAKNVSSAMNVAEARGVITLCLSKNSILLGEYTPLVIKQAVTGDAKADKKLVQEYLKLLLGLQKIIKPDHASDAVAAAITHINSYIPGIGSLTK